MKEIKKQTDEAEKLLAKKDQEIKNHKKNYKDLKIQFKKKKKKREQMDQEKHRIMEEKRRHEKEIERKKEAIYSIEKQVDD